MVSIDHLTNLDYFDLTLKFSQPIYEKTCRKKNRKLVEGSWTKQKMRFTKLVNKSYFPHPHSQWKGGGEGVRFPILDIQKNIRAKRKNHA